MSTTSQHVGISSQAPAEALSGDLLLRSSAARFLGICDRTLLSWERRGLLAPIRTVEGVRLYRLSELQRLALGSRGPVE